MCSHYRADYHLVGEVFLQFFRTLHPVTSTLLGNEFDVGKRCLLSQDIVGSLEDSGSNVDYLILIKRKGFSDCESPSEFKGSPNHWVGGRWRGRCESIGIIEVNSSHIGRNIHQIDLSKEPWQLGLLPIIDSMLVANLLMDEPARHLTIIHSIHQIISSDKITASIDVRLRAVLHSMAVDVDLSLLVANQGLDGGLGVLRTECADDEVGLHVYGLASELVLVSLDQILLELKCNCDAVVFDHFLWG